MTASLNSGGRWQKTALKGRVMEKTAARCKQATLGKGLCRLALSTNQFRQLPSDLGPSDGRVVRLTAQLPSFRPNITHRRIAKRTSANYKLRVLHYILETSINYRLPCEQPRQAQIHTSHTIKSIQITQKTQHKSPRAFEQTSVTVGCFGWFTESCLAALPRLADPFQGLDRPIAFSEDEVQGRGRTISESTAVSA